MIRDSRPFRCSRWRLEDVSVGGVGCEKKEGRKEVVKRKRNLFDKVAGADVDDDMVWI